MLHLAVSEIQPWRQFLCSARCANEHTGPAQLGLIVSHTNQDQKLNWPVHPYSRQFFLLGASISTTVIFCLVRDVAWSRFQPEGSIDRFRPALEPSISFISSSSSSLFRCFLLTTLVFSGFSLFHSFNFFSLKKCLIFSIQVVHFSYAHVIIYRHRLTDFQVYDEYILKYMFE